MFDKVEYLFNILGFKFFNVKYRKLNNENIFTANIISHNNLEKNKRRNSSIC